MNSINALGWVSGSTRTPRKETNGLAATQVASGNRIHVPKTGEVVAAQLRRRIARGELAEDDVLPAESELMEQFGVSRPILREAFRILESEHLIEVRRGVKGGARVRLPNSQAAARYATLLLQLRGATFADVWQARMVIEPAAARMLAEHHSPQALLALRQCHEQALRDGADISARARHADLFHRQLVDVAGNATLAVLDSMLSIILDRRTTEYAASVKRVGRRGQEDMVKAHAQLLDVIEVGDADAAERLWTVHLQHSAESVQAQLGERNARTLVDLLD
jgi:DNA-binding FadR family transcriptional regulator